MRKWKAVVFLCAAVAFFNLHAQNLIENAEFIPSVYEGTPNGAAGWRFYDWTRRNFVKDMKNPYHSGYEMYKFEFGKSSFELKLLPTMPYPDFSFELENRSGTILPPAPEFKLTGEYKLYKGKLSVRFAGVANELAQADEWKKFDFKIIPAKYYSAQLNIKGTFQKDGSFGLRNCVLEPIYPPDTGKIILPGGRELTRIVIPAEPAFKEMRAARFWQGYLWKLSGKALPIALSGVTEPGDLVLKTAKLEKVKNGSYGLMIDKNNFIVTSSNLDGLYSAVHNYIRTFGFRAYTSKNIVWPEKKDALELTAVDKVCEPRFQAVYHHTPSHANIGITTSLNGGFPHVYYRPESDDWYENTHPYIFHNSSFLLPYSRYGKDHPEFYQMDRNGKREPWGSESRMCLQLCTRDEKSPEIIAARMRAWGGHFPEYSDFFVERDDLVDACACPECSKHRHGKSDTDNNLWMVNAVARRVPDMRITTSSYTERTEAPPVETTPENNVNICYCTWPSDWPCSLHVDCPLNHGEGIEHVEGWGMLLKDKSRLSFYVYNENVNSVGFEKVKFLSNHGDLNLFLCVDDDFDGYAYGINRWNWGEDPYKALEEFHRGIYGKAGGKIVEYDALLNKFVREYKHKPNDTAKQSVCLFPFLLNHGSVLTYDQFNALLKVLNEALGAEKEDTDARQSVLYIKKNALSQYLANFPRSKCMTRQELEVFGDRMKEFIANCDEQFNSKSRLSKEWPWFWMKHAISSHDPRRFFFEFAGVTIETPVGKDWTKDPVIQDFVNNTNKYLTFQPKKFYNSHTGYCDTPGGLEWTPELMLGGGGVSNCRYQCPPRMAAVIRRESSDQHKITALFSLKTEPKFDKLLEIIGQDSDKPGKALWALTVNGREIAKGENPFVKSDWNSVVYRIPSDVFKVGENEITITNVTPDPKSSEKEESVYDANGTFMGTTRKVDYTHNWMAINTIRICDYLGDSQSGLPDQKQDFKTPCSIGRPFLLVPGNTYTIKGLVKTNGDLKLRILRLDASTAELSTPRVSLVKDTNTVLSRSCREGDKEVFVKEASSWPEGACHVAFNVLTPPAVAASGVIVKREKLEDGTWKLFFNSPIKVNYHDGLAVACSTPGTNGISKDYKLNGEWIPIEYSFKGFELMQDDPGVVFGRVFFDAQEFSLKDFSIEVKKQ